MNKLPSIASFPSTQPLSYSPNLSKSPAPQGKRITDCFPPAALPPPDPKLLKQRNLTALSTKSSQSAKGSKRSVKENLSPDVNDFSPTSSPQKAKKASQSLAAERNHNIKILTSRFLLECDTHSQILKEAFEETYPQIVPPFYFHHFLGGSDTAYSKALASQQMCREQFIAKIKAYINDDSKLFWIERLVMDLKQIPENLFVLIKQISSPEFHAFYKSEIEKESVLGQFETHLFHYRSSIIHLRNFYTQRTGNVLHENENLESLEGENTTILDIQSMHKEVRLQAFKFIFEQFATVCAPQRQPILFDKLERLMKKDVLCQQNYMPILSKIIDKTLTEKELFDFFPAEPTRYIPPLKKMAEEAFVRPFKVQLEENLRNLHAFCRDIKQDLQREPKAPPYRLSSRFTLPENEYLSSKAQYQKEKFLRETENCKTAPYLLANRFTEGTKEHSTLARIQAQDKLIREQFLDALKHLLAKEKIHSYELSALKRLVDDDYGFNVSYLTMFDEMVKLESLDKATATNDPIWTAIFEARSFIYINMHDD